MMRFAFLAVVLAAPAIGCAHARLVEAHRNGGGVVAIPSNTNAWPARHRRRAEELMSQRCPSGYEIDFEGEFVTGQVAHTTTDTETSRRRTLLGIQVAPQREVSNQTTQFVDQKEWRIWFRPKGSPPASNVPGGSGAPLLPAVASELAP